MTTFSQLVDKMVLELKRPDLRAEICTYLNQTIREVHFEPSRGNVIFFTDNYREEQVTATDESRLVWNVPRPAQFQGMTAVRFDNSYHRDGTRVYAKRLTPGPRMETEDFYYYQAGGAIICGGRKGFGGRGATVSLGWYEYPPALAYYAPDCRPATYRPLYGFTYDAKWIHDHAHEEAQRLTSNWLLLRWDSVIEEGLRAKIFKRLSDTERARTSYSLYAQLRNGLFTSEVADISGID